jgi:hypothetical protein
VKARKLADFLDWALTEGEAQAAALDYAPLPESMAARLREKVATIRAAPR